MAQESPESAVGKVLAPLVSGAAGGLVTWFAAGATGALSHALTTLASALGGIAVLVFSVMYKSLCRRVGCGSETARHAGTSRL